MVKKSEKIRKMYNCRFVLNYATNVDADFSNYIYGNIHDYSKRLVKTAFFMHLVSSRRSCLVNEPERASIFRAKGHGYIFRWLIPP